MNFVRVTLHVDVFADSLGEAEEIVEGLVGDVMNEAGAVDRYEIVEAVALEG